MSRYEQNEGKKYKTILMIMIVLILIVLTIRLYQSTPVDNEIDIKPIVLPIEKKVSDVKKEIQMSGGAEELQVNSEQTQQKAIKSSLNLEIKTELPTLKNSDDSFRQALKDVAENLLGWFEAKDIIKKYLVIINDLSQNQIIYKHRIFLKMPGQIVVKKDSQGLFMAQESYSRYDSLANAIASIDAEKGLRLYLLYKPIFKTVYQDFAYPAGYQLEDIFMKAAASVIESPVTEGRIALVQHSVKYKFADKKLEALSDVEKQMLRMGPANTKKIQAKLRQLVEAISVLNE